MEIIVSILFFTTTLVGNFFSGALADDVCSESERTALLMFKNDLNDPGNRLSSWTGANCCRWVGVVCDNVTGHVHEIRLRNPYDDSCARLNHHAAEQEAYSRNKLGGKLNPSLLYIKKLTHLDLSCNDFGGTRIPDFIGSLENLQYLDLSEAGFEGLIPHQLGNLSFLQYLTIRDSCPDCKTKLHTGNLQWLSRLYSLKYLDLTGVNIIEATNWLQATNNLPSLVDLRLSRCSLRLITSVDFVNFTSLRVLDLSGNKFNSFLPHWIHNLGNLVHLDLSDCGLYNQFPTTLQNMTRLRYLNLSSNNFNSTFPNWFTRFRNLEVFSISDNLVRGELPSSIGNWTSLVTLDLSENQLEGMLPESLGKLCNLKEIYLSRNRFLGDIQQAFTGCISRSLQFLYLGSNNFSGQIPKNLGELSKLRELDLVDNKFSGPLPVSLGQLQELEYLVISLNLLEGSVSEAHFRNLSRLKILRANGNNLIFKPSRNWSPPFQLRGLSLRTWQLGPKFPIWIKHMRHMNYLSLARMGIADAVPAWFWTSTSQLRYLNLSGNLIHGRIPSLLHFGSDWNVAIDLKCNLISGPLPPVSSNISMLDLSHNKISGSMHHFLCSNNAGHKNMLEILNLGSNNLSGEIPDCWMTWPLIRVLRLDANMLTGKIPSSIGFLTRLQSLHLRQNKLSGDMPFSLQKCANLMVLDFGRNQLSGSIPEWINRLSNLIVFNLRLNEFQGNIPPKLCHLSSLQTLDLAGNNLSGRIPRCFNNFSVMAGKQRPTDHIYYSTVDTFGGVPDSQFLVLKGRFGEYTNNLQFVMTLDLSDNSLSGSIPVEMTRLVQVQALNLSRNSLTGSIPDSIGDMELLESLDVSENQLSGEIPQSISGLTFLSHLNLSYNNLTGRIPSGTQIQGFDPSVFIGNQLCGPPMSKDCKENRETASIEYNEERNRSLLGGDGFGLFLSVALGYIFGLWAVLGPLSLSMSWRTTYFRFLTSIGNYIYYVWFKFLPR
ncbi:UNVERIFIED_CONTAM: Receptor-like protein 13 [Sesamum radiatum]|uniref:Receptor-like protein 13 n=1 Tax=Sesamum radiatum TaxID=300843 RepID=A0AAW2JXR0_SESRA